MVTTAEPVTLSFAMIDRARARRCSALQARMSSLLPVDLGAGGDVGADSNMPPSPAIVAAGEPFALVSTASQSLRSLDLKSLSEALTVT